MQIADRLFKQAAGLALAGRLASKISRQTKAAPKGVLPAQAKMNQDLVEHLLARSMARRNPQMLADMGVGTVASPAAKPYLVERPGLVSGASQKPVSIQGDELLKQSGIWDKLNQPIGHWAPLDKLIARAKGVAQGAAGKVQGAAERAQNVARGAAGAARAAEVGGQAMGEAGMDPEGLAQAMKGLLFRARQVREGPAGQAYDFVTEHPKLAIGAGAALGLGVPMGMGYLGGRLAQPGQPVQENA